MLIKLLSHKICLCIMQVGIPALGFSPMNNTPTLLHDDNEFLNENTFLRGIDIYYSIIKSMANH